MNTQPLRRWAANVCLILGVGLPSFVILLDLTRSSRGDVAVHSLFDRLGDLPLLYVGFFLPYLLGGVIYLVGLALVAKLWRAPRRWLVLGVIPAMALGWIAFPLRSALVEPSMAIPLALSAIGTALFVRQQAPSEQPPPGAEARWR